MEDRDPRNAAAPSKTIVSALSWPSTVSLPSPRSILAMCLRLTLNSAEPSMVTSRG
jgi:hypothetical protein